KVEAHPSWGIVVDGQGQVYFSDLKTVWMIDAQGKLSVVRAKGDRHTHDLNIDEAGNLYGADNSYEPATKRFFSAVWKRTPAGSFSYLLPSTENPPKGTSIWSDREGNMYHVTNYPGRELLVLKRSPNGDVVALVGNSKVASEYRQGVPYSIGGTAFGTDGTLYFTYGPNVSKLTKTGALTHLARNLTVANSSGERGSAGSETQLFGIAVDANGNAFVADHGNGRILKITPDNQITTLMRAEESWFPTGVALRSGDLYVLEFGQTRTNTPIGTRVRKLSTDGRITTLAAIEEGVTPTGSQAPDKGSSGERFQGMAEPGRYTPHVLFGAAMGVLILTIAGWLVWRRKYARQHGNT
ncbi:MAG: hypothetical protein LC731_06635, partial [Acidobacteria bacterium]|nr:hypothetical protein [Acidobacteriota bacterium]